MSMTGRLASLGLNALAAAADVAGFESAGKLGAALAGHFGDGSRRLPDTLDAATRRAWSALEAALAGDSLRQRLSSLAGAAEDRVFAGQLQAFLATAPLGGKEECDEASRRMALAELRHARAAGLLGAALDAAALERAVGPLARYGCQDELVEARERALEEVADRLRADGYVYLSRVLKVRPSGGVPLLALALAYFFRRAVEGDEALFRSLSLERIGAAQAASEAGFAALELALDLNAGRVESLLDGVEAVREQLSTQGDQLRAIGDAVQALLEQHRVGRREVRAGDSLTVRDGERRLVRDVVARYHARPEGERRGPALLNAVGKLQVIAGDFADAERDFERAAALADDAPGRAEAQFNAFHAALARRDMGAATRHFRAALADGPARFAPFPLDVYEPERVLGAGGFGVAFLCRHRFLRAPVVVKSLWLGPHEPDTGRVFAEAQLLRRLDHPNIIRISECGYADPSRRERPFLVMDHFDGPTLERHLEEHGPLPLADFLPVARQIAAGLLAAHEGGILHRDVKPANLLVRRDGAWSVRLIDFGLAVHRGEDALTTTRAALTMFGPAAAGTLAYSAPEQLAGEEVGPQADVYAFARTACRALFGTTHPLPRHWQAVPAALADLLGHCLEEKPADRPTGFAEVLARLDAPHAPRPAATPVAPPAPAGPAPDVEVHASVVELARLSRRQLRMGLFEVASTAAYPQVARSEAGGYELITMRTASAEKVHPAREIARLLNGHAPADARLTGQLAELADEARTRAAATPMPFVVLGSIALILLVLCPLFGLILTLIVQAGGGPFRGGNLAPFVIFTVLTPVAGLGLLVLSILTAVSWGQHLWRSRFACDVAEELDAILPGRAAPPPVRWPGPASSSGVVRRIVAAVAAAVLLIAGIITAASMPR